MSLKILPNDHQKTLSSTWFLERKFGKDYDKDSDALLYPIVGSNKTFPPVLNRIGFYCIDNHCWFEFKLPSGRLVAVEYEKRYFDWNLKMVAAENSPIRDEDWDAIELLVRRGVIQDEERFVFERYRRNFRRSTIESKKRICAMKKRLKVL